MGPTFPHPQHCNTLQNTAKTRTHCNTPRQYFHKGPTHLHPRTLQQIVTHCNTLWHTATHTLQHTSSGTSAHASTHPSHPPAATTAFALGVHPRVQCFAVCCSFLPWLYVYTPVRCSVLQKPCSGRSLGAHLSAMGCVADALFWQVCLCSRCAAIVLQCVAVCCSVLQCVAVYCSVLQRVADSVS